jgi:hypothetical protein
MATTINWSISQLDCKSQEDGYTDVVVTAHWQCLGVDPTGSHNVAPDGSQIDISVTAQAYGTINFTLEQGASFTPYNQLTQSQVLGWCYANGVDKDVIEAKLTEQINNEVNPPVVSPPLPWSAAAFNRAGSWSIEEAVGK